MQELSCCGAAPGVGGDAGGAAEEDGQQRDAHEHQGIVCVVVPRLHVTGESACSAQTLHATLGLCSNMRPGTGGNESPTTEMS
jgi:hypothetical protein